MNTVARQAALTLAVISVFSSGAFAQSIPTQLPEVKVTAKPDTLGQSLTQPGIEQARAAMAKVAGGTNIVDAESFREGRVSTFSDTLGMATGVLAQSRFGAEESRLSIRGSGLQRTFHLRGIKLLQDGVPINQADGGGDFQAVEPLATRYIEVFRGSNALRYGAATLGGAINFVSPTGYTAPRLEVRAETGSYGYQRLGFATGGVGEYSDYFVSASTFDQNGFRDHAGQSAQRLNANFGYRVSEDVETRFYFGYAKSDSFLPGNLTKAQLQDNPRQANIGNITGNNKRDIDVMRLANKTTIRFGESRLEIGAWYVDKTLFHPIFQVLDQQNEDYGLDLRYVNSGTLFGRGNEFILGFAPSRGTTEDDRFLNVSGQRGARTNKLHQVASNRELYVENRHHLDDKLILIAGLQHTRAVRRNQDLFFLPGQNESFEATYTGSSPKLGVLYQQSKDVQWFANLSRSYEPPSFGELTGGLAPNINKAQRGTTLELGSRGQSRNVDWDVAVYHAQLRDELLQTQVFAAGNNPLPSPQTSNADRTTHSGMELGLTARLPAQLEWRSNLLLNRFRFDDDATFGNNSLPGVPKVLLRGELLRRSSDGFYAGPTIESSPSAYAVDMAGTVHNDSYTIFGFKLGQQVSKGLSWFVEARNLGDRKYASTTAVSRNLLGVDSAVFLPGDGRSVYAGLQWRQ